jgi:hypothetical protein
MMAVIPRGRLTIDGRDEAVNRCEQRVTDGKPWDILAVCSAVRIMSTDRPQLDYAPSPPWHRRRAVRRCAIFVVLLMAVVCATFRCGRTVKHRVEVYWAMRQCMNYVAPAKQEIYADHPSFADFPFSQAKASIAPPRCWITLEALLPRPSSVPDSAPDWVFCPLAPVFLHRCRSHNGKERFVAVQLGGLSDYRHLGPPTTLCCRVIAPATLFGDPVLIWEASRFAGSTSWGIERMYFGRADELDPSHFTIELDVWGEGTKTIDGWLQDDDTVKLQARDVPAVEP